MNPLVTTLTLTTLIMGTITVMFSSHWLLMWMGLELNMFAILPLITKTHNPRSTEAATKYFMVQASASMIFLMATLINFMMTGNWNVNTMYNELPSLLILLSLLIKLGMAPFHFWVPEVTQGTNMLASLIILTWQKLAPLSILYQISTPNNHKIIMWSALLSIALGGWGGLNQTQLRKILAYSSIAHLGWMTTSTCYSPTLMMFYFTTYIIMTIPTFMLMIKNKTTSTATLALAWNKIPITMTLLMLILLSTGGLPPFTGFLPKWLIIYELVSNSNILIPTIMTILALLNLFFYTRIIYSSSLTMFPTTNNMKMEWKMSHKPSSITLTTLITLAILAMPLAPTLLPIW
uniref:NADH-ubiquinone oxidoreductase chain 2 n=1 Tax=Micropotamogale ruwenzorii TaxID=1833875 RepID=A0A161H6Y5_9EUTH|nr:NADH dehydrogenase subunit 2 [Micropotamogale ruwenzorii]